MNWWLRHTSSGWQQSQGASGASGTSLAQREQTRRSRRASWLILALLVGMAILSPLALADARARVALAMGVGGLVLAAALNRRGWVTLAGVVLVGLISGGLLVATLASPVGLTMGDLPTFDAYVVSVVVAATLLPGTVVFLVAAGNAGLIVGTYFYQPHDATIGHDAARYSSVAAQTAFLLARPIALQLFLAVVVFLWVRGAQEALRRAERAEEIALAEHQDYEQTFALQEGVRYLHQALSRWTTGDIRHRIPAMPVAVLEQVRYDLNTFIERFGPAMQASFHLHRLQEETHRLTAALEAWVQGSPVVWPAPSGTALDRAVMLLRFASQNRPIPPIPSPLSPPLPPSPRPAHAMPPPGGPAGGPAASPAGGPESQMPPGRPVSTKGSQTGGPEPPRPERHEPDRPDWLRP